MNKDDFIKEKKKKCSSYLFLHKLHVYVSLFLNDFCNIFNRITSKYFGNLNSEGRTL